MSLYEKEKKFHEVFGLQPRSEDFDGHRINLYDLSDGDYLRLLMLLAIPHVDALGEVHLNEDSNFNEFKERILEAVIFEYEHGYLEEEYVKNLF